MLTKDNSEIQFFCTVKSVQTLDRHSESHVAVTQVYPFDHLKMENGSIHVRDLLFYATE